MTKRFHIIALVAAAVLAGSVTGVAATTSKLGLGSAPRATVTPPSVKRAKQPQAAKAKALKSAVAAATKRVHALQKALARAKTTARKHALKKSLAAAVADLKALQRALAKAKKGA